MNSHPNLDTKSEKTPRKNTQNLKLKGSVIGDARDKVMTSTKNQ